LTHSLQCVPSIYPSPVFPTHYCIYIPILTVPIFSILIFSGPIFFFYLPHVYLFVLLVRH
jgi:hypothetical protein